MHDNHPILPIAADIAAWLRLRAQENEASGVPAILHAGLELLGVDVIAVYWNATKEVDSTTAECPVDGLAYQLFQRMRHLIWPWLQSESPESSASAMLLPADMCLEMNATVHLLPLFDSTNKLGGVVALAGSFNIEKKWSAADIDLTQVFSCVVRQELTGSLDTDTGLLHRDAFLATARRWHATEREDKKYATLILLTFNNLIDLEIQAGHWVARAALREILALLRTRLRARDLVGRVDRHTVAVMMKQCDSDTADAALSTLTDVFDGHQYATKNSVYATRCDAECIPISSNTDLEQLLPIENVKHVRRVELQDNSAEAVDNVLAFKPAGAAVLEPTQGLPSGQVNLSEMRAQPGVLLQNTDAIACYRLRVLGELDSADGEAVDVSHCRAAINEIANNMSLNQRSLLPVLIVDVSAELIDDARMEWLLACCAESRVPLSTFCLAFTELDLMNELNSALSVLGRVHREGLQLMLTSPGTSPYAYHLQKQLPFDFIELQPSLFYESVHDDFKRAMLQAQVLVAHSLNIQIVGVNLDSKSLLQFAHSLGVDIGLGRLCGRSVGLDSIGLDKLAGD